MKRKTNPVTPEDGEKFDAYVRKWQGLLNLNDWRIVKSSRSASKGAMAEVTKRDLKGRLAVYRLGVDFGATPVDEGSLEQTAVHELLHVFLYELLEYAKDPKTTEEDLEGLEHRVVNVLERLLVKA